MSAPPLPYLSRRSAAVSAVRHSALWVVLAPFVVSGALFLAGILAAVLALRSVLLFALGGADRHLWLATALSLAAYGLLRNFNPNNPPKG